MAIDNRHDIRVLNGLYAATLDNADAYREVADATADPGHKGLYETREAERRTLADDLAGSITTLGGEASQGSGLMAKAQKVVKDVKHALGRDEAATLNEVESGESALLDRFDRALEDTDISATTRETLRRARVHVQRGHDEIGALKSSVQGQKDADSPLYPQ